MNIELTLSKRVGNIDYEVKIQDEGEMELTVWEDKRLLTLLNFSHWEIAQLREFLTKANEAAQVVRETGVSK